MLGRVTGAASLTRLATVGRTELRTADFMIAAIFDELV